MADQRNVDDDAESDDSQPAVRYSIASYGADPDVENLVKRLKKGEIIIPPFNETMSGA